MGRITTEVSNEVGIKLPEVCPLHKHKISFYGSGDTIINYDYYKHRVGTDDAYTDGQQYHDCGDFLVPDGYKITTVTNGTSSGGNSNSRTGTVHINSNEINTFDGNNLVEVKVNVKEIIWEQKEDKVMGTKAQASETDTSYLLPWDATSAVYRYIYLHYYEDKDYPDDIYKTDGDDIYGSTWYTFTFSKNTSEDHTKWVYCLGGTSGDFVILAKKPVIYTVNGDEKSGIKGETAYIRYSKSEYESVSATATTETTETPEVSVSEFDTYWRVSWRISRGLAVTITATSKSSD